MAIDWWRLQSSLIDQVKKHPCLYDGSQLSHWNPRRREPYWRAVAQAVDMPDVSEVECRRLWRGLRDKYVREIQLGATRAPDGTLVRAESQWPLLKRLDFLRHHIRRRRRSQKAAMAHSDTYDLRPTASVTADSSRQLRPGALSPVDLEIDASPGLSMRTDSTDGWESIPPSTREATLTVSAVRSAAEEQADFPASSDVSGRAVGSEPRDTVSRRTQSLPKWQPPSEDAAQRAHKRWRSEDNKPPEDWISYPGYSSADDSEIEGGSGAGVDYRHNRDRGSDKRTRNKDGDIEAALCRFLTATTRKMAASSAAPCAPPAGHGGRELRVNAGDADALFLLGLKGLMGTLDAESKSRAQMDIMRLLRDRIAEAPRRPQSVGDGNCDVSTTSEQLPLT